MNWYRVRVEWSQTDKETIVLQATSKTDAESRVKAKCNARYVTCEGTVIVWGVPD